MYITIHQPEHLPWLGFLDKAAQADCIVILDNVQFRKNYFHNRNKVRTASGFSWITVPIKRHESKILINEVEIDNTHKWALKYYKTIFYSYNKAPYFRKYNSYFQSLLQKKWEKLVDLNMELIRFLFSAFNIETEIVMSSALENTRGKGSELLLSICRQLKAKEYLSGISGKEYLDEKCFTSENIRVNYQEFYHPVYKQLYEPFMHCMSSIDLLFLYGEDAPAILFSDKVERLAYLIP